MKILLREEVWKFEVEVEFWLGMFGELIDVIKGMIVVDINMEEVFVEERKKKWEEEWKGVIDVVKIVVVGKFWVKR